jgi:hypothetical protein
VSSNPLKPIRSCGENDVTHSALLRLLRDRYHLVDRLGKPRDIPSSFVKTRLHQFAVAEGVSLQSLALLGLSKVFADHGLPPIRHDVRA